MVFKKNKKMVFKAYKSSLDDVPFHNSIKGIERFIFKDFPLRVAVHKVKIIKSNKKVYAKPHKHKFHEINILLGNNLKYKIMLGRKDFIVKSPSAIWIPAGIEHSANVIKGEGYFLCLILSKEYEAFKN